MSILDFFKQKKKDNRANYDFTDADRELSEQIRKQKAELKRLQLEREAELSRLRYEKQKLELMDEIEAMKEAVGFYSDDDEPEADPNDALLSSLLMAVLQNKNPSNSGVANAPPLQTTATPEVNLTDEQINELLNAIPKKYIKIAKSLTDDTLRNIIKGQIPTASSDTVERCLFAIRGR